jgi:hypothetical protein
MGGSLDWDYGSHPNVDEETRTFVGSMADEWVEGPLKFFSDEEDGDRTVATGMRGKGLGLGGDGSSDVGAQKTRYETVAWVPSRRRSGSSDSD